MFTFCALVVQHVAQQKRMEGPPRCAIVLSCIQMDCTETPRSHMENNCATPGPTIHTFIALPYTYRADHRDGPEQPRARLN